MESNKRRKRNGKKKLKKKILVLTRKRGTMKSVFLFCYGNMEGSKPRRNI